MKGPLIVYMTGGGDGGSNIELEVVEERGPERMTGGTLLQPVA